MFSSYRNQSADLLCKSTDWFLYMRTLVIKGLRKIYSVKKCIINFKLSFVFHAHEDQFFLKVCTKFLGKVIKIKGVKSKRTLHICKWAFLQVPSLCHGLEVFCHWLCKQLRIKIKSDDIKQKSLVKTLP